MTLSEFYDLLDRCGADEARWPPGAAPAARRLLAASAEARAGQAALAAAEAALAASPSTGTLPDFAAAAVATAQLSPLGAAATLERRWLLGIAACLVLSVGVMTGAVRATAEDPSAVLTAALSNGMEAGDVE